MKVKKITNLNASIYYWNLTFCYYLLTIFFFFSILYGFNS